MITMEELQGYPVADDKEIRDAHNKAVSLIEHNVDEFFDCFPGANSENNFYRQTENTDWTEGFWTGELWFAYESNKDDKLKEAALCQVDNFLYRIEHHINTDHHDMGFCTVRLALRHISLQAVKWVNVRHFWRRII